LKFIELIGFFDEFREESSKEICKAKLTPQEKDIIHKLFSNFTHKRKI